MYKKHRPLRALSLAVTMGCFLPGATFASNAPSALLNPDIKKAKTDQVMTVSAPVISPLNVVTDLKTPRQPVPASDGSDYLKTIPGFSQIRNGGTNGEPGRTWWAKVNVTF